MKKLILVFAFSILLVSSGSAELLQVDLTIFGMDWALCAHAVRTGIEKLDGVNSVEVSLEKGLAKIELKPENKITLSQIQTIVKKNGFSPKSAQLKLKGKMGDKQVTITKSNESITAVWNEEQLIDPQKEYVIQGNLEITEKDSQITVSSIQEK